MQWMRYDFLKEKRKKLKNALFLNIQFREMDG